MPRKSRIDAAGALHHIICRGIERGRIFQDDIDREQFVKRMAKVLSETSTRCYAWALIPNHFHLLLATGKAPVATLMRRLLTGYAVTYNRRYHRHGYLFQNRYKSILCQEDQYLLELVRYIHLNPLRAKLVGSIDELAGYPYCGHSRLTGKIKSAWQDTASVLSLFGKRLSSARKHYLDYVFQGVAEGKRPELTGGGLVRSSGGWGVLRSMPRMGRHLKGDERILGDSDFVESVLRSEEERMERKYQLHSKGYDFEKLVKRVAESYAMEAKEVLTPGKQPNRVKARSLLCYWAVRELGMSCTVVAEKLGMTQPGVSKAVERGKEMARNKELISPPLLHPEKNFIIS
jgi:REP element-mobilizing transposase RayT